MIQKEKKIWRDGAGIFFLFFLFYIFSQGSAVLAQSLPSVNPGDIGAETVAGMPVSEIMSAFKSGGISTKQSLTELEKPTDEVKIADSTETVSSLNVADPAPVSLNPDSLKVLESQGGISSKPESSSGNPTVFNLATKFLEKVIFHSDTEFAKRPTFDDGMDITGAPTFDKDTAGYAIIKRGNQSVVIDFENEYDSAPIVTASLSLQQYKDADVRAAAEDLLLVSDVKYIVTKVDKKGFEIMMDRRADSDIPFSWHAIAVKDPKTFKKEGESLDSGNIAGSDADFKNFGTENSGQSAPLETNPDTENRGQAAAATSASAGGNFSLTAGDAAARQVPQIGSGGSNPNQ
jgi:hypothetical protein